MSGSIRNAEELSTTTAPEAHAAAANSLLREAPAENRAMSIPLKASFESSSTGNSCPANFSFFPTDRSDARRRRFPIGNFRSARICRKTLTHRAGRAGHGHVESLAAHRLTSSGIGSGRPPGPGRPSRSFRPFSPRPRGRCRPSGTRRRGPAPPPSRSGRPPRAC